MCIRDRYLLEVQARWVPINPMDAVAGTDVAVRVRDAV